MESDIQSPRLHTRHVGFCEVLKGKLQGLHTGTSLVYSEHGLYVSPCGAPRGYLLR
jgi:hypothetical protein